MIDFVSKPKPPEGRSYVLRTSHLEKALVDARIDCHVELVYWIPQSGGSILEGHYWLPNEHVSHARVHVRAGVVPSELRFTALEALITAALPAFIDWLKGLLDLPEDSPALHQSPYFNAAYTEKGLSVAHQPAYKGERTARTR